MNGGRRDGAQGRCIAVQDLPGRLEHMLQSAQNDHRCPREVAAMHGTFIWTELLTDDVAAAQAAYAKLAGWTYARHTTPDDEPYWVASLAGQPVAGLMSLASLPPGAPPHWLTYLGVEDVDASVALMESQGGAISKAPFDVPGVGRIAVVFDVQGACLGLMTPVPR
jgi:predicted enzyme related to lactoylglutathione lyase